MTDEIPNQEPIPAEGLPPEGEVQLLRDYAEKAYLDYSMYVILDRALRNFGECI